MSPRFKRLYWPFLALGAVFLCGQILLFRALSDSSSISPHTLDKKPQSNKPGSYPIYNAQDFQRSCNDLFGAHQLEIFQDGKCLKHSLLNWISCMIGPIRVDTERIEGSVGGELIQSVMNRSLEVEFLSFKKGSLILKEPLFDKLLVNTGDPVMRSFLDSSILLSESITAAEPITNVTLLVRRTTYANPCMALLSIYNAFVVLKYLHGDLDGIVDIIWLDGHSQSPNLDAIWERLFHIKPMHVKQLNGGKQNIGNAILVNTDSAIGDTGLGIYGWSGDADSCGENENASIHEPCSNSTLVQFRDFVLGQYGATRKRAGKNCQLTFLIRKDYVAHPRANGRTDRTIANLQEEVAFIQSQHPKCQITTVAFEDIRFEEQLRIVSQSDIFVAVHGAGNIHVLFLPDHAVFVEYFPKRFQNRRRFQYLAQCLNIQYQQKKATVEETLADGKIVVRLRP